MAEIIIRKGQFFLVALLLLALSMFILFSFFRTTDTASVTLFTKSSFIEFKNIQNAITEKNKWLDDNDWWNASWMYRMHMSGVSAASPAVIDIPFPSGHIDYCNETRIINYTGNGQPVLYNVSAQTPPCSFYIYTNNRFSLFYIYYGNIKEIKPPLLTDKTGAVMVPTFGKEEISNLCEHLEYVYPIQGIHLECNISNAFSNNQKINYSVNFTSLNLQFKGYIN